MMKTTKKCKLALSSKEEGGLVCELNRNKLLTDPYTKRKSLSFSLQISIQNESLNLKIIFISMGYWDSYVLLLG